MTHPLQFGIITVQDQPWAKMVEHWKRVESLGFDSVWVADHFLNSHHPETDWFDGWTILSALATQTSRIRLGTLVTNIIYRNPATIAKQALTLDHISQGRLSLGIGATSDRDLSHSMTGVENWKASERAGRFREIIEIVDQMLRNETTTFQGHYYNITNARMRPSTIQKPRPPLVVAAAGETTLKVAAKYADTWNTYGGINLSEDETLSIIRQRSGLLDRYCAEMGRDPSEITHSFLAGFTADTPFASLNAFYDFVGRLQEIGITEFIFYYDYAFLPPDRCLNLEMMERVALEAIPTLRSKEAG